MKKSLLFKMLTIVMAISLLTACSRPNVAVKAPDALSAEADNKQEENLDEIADTDKDIDSDADFDADTDIDTDTGNDTDNDTGADANTGNGKTEDSQENSTKQTAKEKIAFEIVDVNSLSEQLISDIDALKLQRGYAFWPQDDGSYLILISAGEKPTGGYGIEVNSIESMEERTIITVTETEPAPDAMSITVLTYPSVVIKASGITDELIIHDQNQKKYEELR